MLPFSIFILSGVGIVTLTVAKRLEEKRRAQTIVLRAVSKGDERMRDIHHKALHHYSYSKEKFAFWFKKQLPLKLKSLWHKVQLYVREKSVEYLGDVRNSRLLKKSDGISEFFKNISEIEKGGGEINDEVFVAEPMPTLEPIVPAMLPKKPRTPRKPKVVKLTVTEEL